MADESPKAVEATDASPAGDGPKKLTAKEVRSHSGDPPRGITLRGRRPRQRARRPARG